MQAKDVIFAIVLGVLTALIVFNALSLAAVLFPIESLVIIHSIGFSVIGIGLGYFISQRRNKF